MCKGREPGNYYVSVPYFSTHIPAYICSAHDNVRSSDNFRPIRACDRLCAIMVGQNVRARDNARIINYIAYWPAVRAQIIILLWARIQQHYSYLGPGYWKRLMTVWVQPHGFYKLTSWLTQHITC